MGFKQSFKRFSKRLVVLLTLCIVINSTPSWMMSLAEENSATVQSVTGGDSVSDNNVSGGNPTPMPTPSIEPPSTNEPTVQPTSTPAVDITKPVFEGVSVRYDAASNKVYFDVRAYDAESSPWRIYVGFTNGNGQTKVASIFDVSTNPFTIEYLADYVENGTYWISYINIYDGYNNGIYKSFTREDGYIFEVTNSNYQNEIVIENITASKDSVVVGTGVTEEVTITIELERGESFLAKDTSNNNRVGYCCYDHSDYIDLYLNEDGTITGTYVVDFVASTGDECMNSVVLNCTDDTYTEGFRRERFSYDYGDAAGAFRVENTDSWQKENNYGPFTLSDISVKDKATGNEIEPGQFFDVSNGQTHTLILSYKVEEAVPEGVTFGFAYDPSLADEFWDFIELEHQGGGIYSGELVIDSGFACTEWLFDSWGCHRGDVGNYYNFKDINYINVKNGSYYVVNTYDVSVRVTDSWYGEEELYYGTFQYEGRAGNRYTLEEVMGGPENYAALLAMTERADGSVCDGWKSFFVEQDNVYQKDDTVPYKSWYYFYPVYSYHNVSVVFTYIDENGQYAQVESPTVRVDDGKYLSDAVALLEEQGAVPVPVSQPDGEYLGWTFEVYEDSDWFIRQDQTYYVVAQYTNPMVTFVRKVMGEDGTYENSTGALLATETLTVGEAIRNMAAPSYVPEGYAFLRWEITEGSQCYIGSELIDGEWVSQYVDWEEDMLVETYWMPSLTAIYERVNDSDEGEATPVPTPTPEPTPEPTPAPTRRPAPAPVVTPVEPTVDRPAIETPQGVALSQERVAETVTTIIDALARIEESTEETVERPVVVLDMRAEDGEVATMVPVEVLEVIRGRDVDVVLDMGGYSWTINGSDVKATDLSTINLEVKVDTQAIPSKMVEALSNGAPATQISLTHEGNFGFKASLSLNLGSENAGQYGNMYYYDSDNRLVFMNAGQIDEQGNVSLNFSHASDYVVIVGDEVVAEEGTAFVEADGKLVANADENKPEAPKDDEVKADDEQQVTESSPSDEEASADSDDDGKDNSETNYTWIIIIVVVVIVLILAVVLILLKKKNK